MKLNLLILIAANFGSAVFCMFTLNYMLFANANHSITWIEPNMQILIPEAIASILFVLIPIAYGISELFKHKTLSQSRSADK